MATNAELIERLNRLAIAGDTRVMIEIIAALLTQQNDSFVAKNDLASTAASKGASLTGVRDADGYFSGDTAESALQQLAVFLFGNETDVAVWAASKSALAASLTSAHIGHVGLALTDISHNNLRTAYDIIDTGGGVPGLDESSKRAVGFDAIRSDLLDTASGKGFNLVAYSLAPGETSETVVSPQYPPGNLFRYGGIGNGVASVVEDTAAFQRALAYVRAQGHGSIYVPATGSFFAYAGPGEVAPDYLELYGDGEEASHIRHVDPDQGIWYKGVILYPGTYAAADSESIQVETFHDINDVGAHTDAVVFDTAGDADEYDVGDLVVLVSGASYTIGGGHKRYAIQETNEVIGKGSGTITLKRPTTDAYITAGGSSPQICKLNTGQLHSSGLEHRMSRGLYIHDLKLSVADTDEVNGGALVTTPNAALQLGGTYESKIERVTIDGYRGFTGNMWCYTDVQVKLRSYYQMLDVGYGSHSGRMDVDWEFRPSAIGGSQASLFYAHEGSHDLVYRLRGGGKAWDGTNVCNGAASSRRITGELDIRLPSLTSNGSVFDITDEDANNYVAGFVMRGRVEVGSIGRWIRASSGAGGPASRGIDFSGMTFVGADEGSFTASMVNITNLDGVNIENMVVPVGGLTLTAVTNSRLGAYAPAGALTTSGAMTGSVLAKGVFASSNVATTGYAGLARVGSASIHSGDLQVASAKIYSQRATFSATNGAAVEFRSTSALSPYVGGTLSLHATSDDGTTAIAAMITIAAGGNVTIVELGSIAAALSTDGTNLKYTNSAGTNKTVRWSIRAL